MTEQHPEKERAGRLGVPSAALGQAQQVTEETAQKLLRAFEDSQPVQRIRGSQVLSAFLGTIGLALLIVGIENAAADIPLVSNPYGSIAVGLVLLAATGLLLRKLTGPE